MQFGREQYVYFGRSCLRIRRRARDPLAGARGSVPDLPRSTPGNKGSVFALFAAHEHQPRGRFIPVGWDPDRTPDADLARVVGVLAAVLALLPPLLHALVHLLPHLLPLLLLLVVQHSFNAARGLFAHCPHFRETIFSR